MKDKNEEFKYSNFKEIINVFYQDIIKPEKIENKKYGKEYGQITIIPKIKINQNKTNLKVE